MFGRKPLWRLIEQWDAMRRARPSHPNPNAKTERNAEIVWMYQLGVPMSHIARVHDISAARVRAIVSKAGK
jgi:hypothetical protein